MSASRRRRILKSLLWIIAAVFVLVAVTLVVGRGASLRKETTVKAAWDQSHGSWDEFMARYPAREANAAARTIEALASDLGIDLAQASPGEMTRSGGQCSLKPRVSVGRYLSQQLERAATALEAPPEEIVEYFTEHDEQLEALRRALLNGETPLWRRDLSLLYDAPVPNLVGQLNLHRALLAHALVRLREGDHATALADLKASWRLSASLDDNPILINQLIAVTVTRIQIGTLRHMDPIPEAWVHRLETLDHRTAMLEALAFENRQWLYVNLTAQELADDDGAPWILRVLGEAYWLFGVADGSERWRRLMVDLAAIEHPCDPSAWTLVEGFRESVPSWNIPGRILTPSVPRALAKVGRLELDIELTRKIIEIKSARAPDGTWPQSVQGIETSLCPDSRWIYSVTPLGVMTIELDHEIEWPRHTGSKLPNRYTAPPPDVESRV